jgi:hypothetical protein
LAFRVCFGPTLQSSFVVVLSLVVLFQFEKMALIKATNNFTLKQKNTLFLATRYNGKLMFTKRVDFIIRKSINTRKPKIYHMKLIRFTSITSSSSSHCESNQSIMDSKFLILILFATIGTNSSMFYSNKFFCFTIIRSLSFYRVLIITSNMWDTTAQYAHLHYLVA